MPQLDRAGIIDIYETLKLIKSAFDEPYHLLVAAQARRALADCVEPMIETRDSLQELMPTEFQEERTALLVRVSKKGPDEKPVIAQNQYVIDPALQSDFDKEFAALKLKHKEKLDAYEAKVKEINKFLKAKDDYPDIPQRFKMSWFNKNVSQDWLETLLDYIDVDIDSAPAKPAKGEESEGPPSNPAAAVAEAKAASGKKH